jgi:hypothetical protein
MNIIEVSWKYAVDSVFANYPQDFDLTVFLDALRSDEYAPFPISRYSEEFLVWQPYENLCCEELYEKLLDESISFERYYRMVDEGGNK